MFICSKEFSNSIKGQSGLIEVAKGFKASSIVVVSQTDETFSGKEDLGGKLNSYKFPEENEAEDSLNEYGFQIIATLGSKEQSIYCWRSVLKKFG